MTLWVCAGLTSNVVKQTLSVTAATSGTISVAAGDFLFVAESGVNTPTPFTSSTQIPTDIYTPNAQTNFADWLTVTSGNASFVVEPTSAGSISFVAATYH